MNNMRSSKSNNDSNNSNNSKSDGGSEIWLSKKIYKEQEQKQGGGGGGDGEVDLGLKLQNQHPSFVSNKRIISCDDDGRIGGVHANCNKMSDISSSLYDMTCTAVTPDSTSSLLGVDVGVRSFHLQPFDVSYSSFIPSGSGMATGAVGFPFTASQWKELGRQAMIYKYMVASLPVPPNLLYSSFPTNSTTFAPTSYLLGKYGNGLNFKWVGNSKDAEPGRCRRTDGKKWRCSRDVAPNQKYCERHMHRGRPRSRKPVEQLQQTHALAQFPVNKSSSIIDSTIKNNNPTKKTRLNDVNPLQSVGSSCFPSVSPAKSFAFHHPMASGATTLFEDSRNMGWTEEQQWQQLVQANMDSQVYQHQFEGDQSLNLNIDACLVSKSDMGLLERPLIDAWSMGITGIKDNSESNKPSFGSSNVDHDELCQIHMGLGVLDQWAGTSPALGGPLAEVLGPGSVSNPSTSDAGEGEFITPTATTVSSPSGVLQKTVATFSDSSGSSSPTGHHSKPKSDMPFHWLN